MWLEFRRVLFRSQMGELVYLFSYIIVVAAFLVYLLIIPRAVLAGREGSLLLLFGYILVMVCGINDILFDLRLVYTARILPIGLLFYISLHSGLLAIRFASALTVSEDLGNELEEKNIALSRLDTLKDEFIANTTHELCTPLSGIIGIAESMIAGAVGDLSKRAVQNLEMLVASGKRLNGLVNNILDYSDRKSGV